MYDIYRWDSVGSAFTYRTDYKVASFTASGETYVYEDAKSFPSDGTTYYRVLKAE